MYSKIYPKLKMLGRIRCYIGQGTALYLYNCLINPLFTFSDVVYDTISNTDAHRLQVLQNNCIRVCLKCDKLTLRQVLYEMSGIKPLDVQRKENTCVMVYKGLNQESTPFLNNLFSHTLDVNSKVTRLGVQGGIYVPNTRLKLTEGNIRTRGPMYYNRVPSDIWEAKTRNTLKKHLKKSNVFDQTI